MLTIRVVKYKTKLTEDGQAVLSKEYSTNYPEINNKMNSPEKVAAIARTVLHMHEETEEYMYMFCLNTKLKLVGIFEISHGNVNSSIVGCREVFQKALLGNAVSIVLIHNHPSGDVTPSREDIKVTERLRDAGNLLGVQVLDHLIVSSSGFTSLKEKGYL